MPVLSDEVTHAVWQINSWAIDLRRLADLYAAVNVLPTVLERISVGSDAALFDLWSGDNQSTQREFMEQTEQAIAEAREFLDDIEGKFSRGGEGEAAARLKTLSDYVVEQQPMLQSKTVVLTDFLIRWGTVLSERMDGEPTFAAHLASELSRDELAPAILVLAYVPEVAQHLAPHARALGIQSLLGYVPEPSRAEVIVAVYRDWLAGRGEWAAMLAEQGIANPQDGAPRGLAPQDGAPLINGETAGDLEPANAEQSSAPTGLLGVPPGLRLETLVDALEQITSDGDRVAEYVVEIAYGRELALQTRRQYKSRGVESPLVGPTFALVMSNVETLDDVPADARSLLADVDGDEPLRRQLAAAFARAVAAEHVTREQLVGALTEVFGVPDARSALSAVLDKDQWSNHALLRAARDRANGLQDSLVTPADPPWYRFASDAGAIATPTTSDSPGVPDHFGLAAQRIVRRALVTALESDTAGSVTGLNDDVRETASVVEKLPTLHAPIGAALAASSVLGSEAARPLVAVTGPGFILSAPHSSHAFVAHKQLLAAIAADRALMAPTMINGQRHAMGAMQSAMVNTALAGYLANEVAPVLGVNREVTAPPGEIELAVLDAKASVDFAAAGTHLHAGSRVAIVQQLGFLSSGSVVRAMRRQFADIVAPLAEAIRSASPDQVAAAASRLQGFVLPEGEAAASLRRAFASRGRPLHPDDRDGPEGTDGPSLPPGGPPPQPQPRPQGGPAGPAAPPTPGAESGHGAGAASTGGEPPPASPGGAGREHLGDQADKHGRVVPGKSRGQVDGGPASVESPRGSGVAGRRHRRSVGTPTTRALRGARDARQTHPLSAGGTPLPAVSDANTANTSRSALNPARSASPSLGAQEQRARRGAATTPDRRNGRPLRSIEPGRRQPPSASAGRPAVTPPSVQRSALGRPTPGPSGANGPGSAPS